MKFLKYLIFLLLIAVIALAIYVAVQPNSYDVKRTKLIKAPAEVVFNNINDLKKWEDWGPWHDEDTTIVSTYSDNTVGLGAKSSWTSKDGPGNMKVVNVVPNKSVDLKMQFSDYEPSDINWTFEEADGGTNVTWGMKSDSNPFMFKLFGVLSGGMDNMLGPMQEKGLENLANVVAKQMENMPKAEFKLGDIVEMESPAQTFIGYKQNSTVKAAMEGMTKLFMEFLPKAGEYAMANLKEGEFVPGAVWTKWDEEKDEAEFYIGLLLKKNIPPAEGMEALNLPKGNTIKLSKFGNYGTGDYEAHNAIADYMKNNNKEVNGEAVWELYVNDPSKVKPMEVQTDIYYPVK